MIAALLMRPIRCTQAAPDTRTTKPFDHSASSLLHLCTLIRCLPKPCVQFTGFILIPSPGLWTMTLTSDDGSRLWLDGVLAVNDGGQHGDTAQSSTLNLTAGWHPLTLDYFQWTMEADVSLLWSSSSNGVAKQVVPPAYFCSIT